MAKLLHKFPAEVEEMDAHWFMVGLACEAYEVELQKHAQADAAKRNGKTLRTIGGAEYRTQ